MPEGLEGVRFYAPDERRGGTRGGARARARGAGARVSAPLAEDMAVVTGLWAQLRVPDRARYLERAAQAVIDEFEELCMAIAGESRRPRAEIASLELLAAIDALRWLSENSRRLTGARRFAPAAIAASADARERGLRARRRGRHPRRARRALRASR